MILHVNKLTSHNRVSMNAYTNDFLIKMSEAYLAFENRIKRRKIRNESI